MACALQALVSLAVTVGATARNPFHNQRFYVNPVNERAFDSSIATAGGTVKRNLRKMQKVPSAYWIDKKSKIWGNGTRTVEGILREAASKAHPELVVFMWYDLPNRDCDARASNGEICCTRAHNDLCDYVAPGDCSAGIEEYKAEYVDRFVAVLKVFEHKLPVVLVIEPDSLANIATNTKHPPCGNVATQTAYKEGVKYAVDRVTSEVPSVSVYLDAAHGGWLGWENTMEKFMRMIRSMDLPLHKIRGFATNVANYQPLGIQCPWCPDQGYRNGYCMNGKHASDPCCEDPCDMLSQWNFGNNELNYAAGLVAAASAVLGMDAHVVIDTGRNGVTDQRSDCANWCNPRGAGAGVPSTTQTANTSLVDAYFWLKTPGESDGCTRTLPDGQQCPRFDSKCSSADSIGTESNEPRAPGAGQWYDYQVKQLAANAHFSPPASGASNGQVTCPASTAAAIVTAAVRITAAAAPGPTPAVVWRPSSADTPSPAPPPAADPTSKASTGSLTDIASSTSASAPSAASATCAVPYGQCGGSGWTGPTCCDRYCKCKAVNSSRSECVPQFQTLSKHLQDVAIFLRKLTRREEEVASLGGAGTPSSTVHPGVHTSISASATSTSSSFDKFSDAPMAGPAPAPQASSAPSARCSAPSGQCGGSGWGGPTCCDTDSKCQVINASRSECVPRHGAGAQGRRRRKGIFLILKDELGGSTRDPSTPRALAGRTLTWGVLTPALVLVGLAGVRSLGARSQLGRPPIRCGRACGRYDSLPGSSAAAPGPRPTLPDVEAA